MKSPPAVVLCCSKAGLAVARSLGAAGVPVIGVWYGRSQLACKSRFVASCQRSPDPDEDEEAFLDFLISRSDEWTGAVLFPSDDASLLSVSRHKARLAQHYRVIAEDWDVVRPLLEKVHTTDIAMRCGVPCPRIQPITDVAQALAFARDIGFPCIVKPSVGHTFFNRYHAKMVFAHSADELARWLDRFQEYPDELMLCEFIPGDDTCGANYNSFFVHAEPHQEFTAAKVRLKPTRIGFPTAVVSRRIPEVVAYGRKLLQSIGYHGFSCAEFKRDERDGVYKLMEINARHNFSGSLAFRCGINFPYLSYLDAVGETLPSEAVEQTDGIYWIDEERDLKGLVGSLIGGARGAQAYLRPYLNRSVFAVFSMRDIRPSFQQAGETLRAMGNRGGDSRLPAGTFSDRESKT